MHMGGGISNDYNIPMQDTVECEQQYIIHDVLFSMDLPLVAEIMEAWFVENSNGGKQCKAWHRQKEVNVLSVKTEYANAANLLHTQSLAGRSVTCLQEIV